jgi:hypothetical protein
MPIHYPEKVSWALLVGIDVHFGNYPIFVLVVEALFRVVGAGDHKVLESAPYRVFF